MTTTKIRKPGLNYDVELLRAMADETRQSILRHLCTPGAGQMRSYSVTDIAENVSLSPSTVSHHLQTLRRSGLVEVERHGKERRYSIHLDALRTSVTQFYDLLNLIEGAMERAARKQPQEALSA
jgi:DNA-binding transcriptional ArsR family regulator